MGTRAASPARPTIKPDPEYELFIQKRDAERTANRATARDLGTLRDYPWSPSLTAGLVPRYVTTGRDHRCMVREEAPVWALAISDTVSGALVQCVREVGSDLLRLEGVMEAEQADPGIVTVLVRDAIAGFLSIEFPGDESD